MAKDVIRSKILSRRVYPRLLRCTQMESHISLRREAERVLREEKAV